MKTKINHVSKANLATTLIIIIFTAIMILTSCKKEGTITPQQVQPISTVSYEGVYLIIDSLSSGSGQRDTAIVFKDNNKYYIKRLNNAVGNNILLELTNYSFVISKNSYIPKTYVTISGYGYFKNSLLILDYETISENGLEDYICHGEYKKL